MVKIRINTLVLINISTRYYGHMITKVRSYKLENISCITRNNKQVMSWPSRAHIEAQQISPNASLAKDTNNLEALI